MADWVDGVGDLIDEIDINDVMVATKVNSVIFVNPVMMAPTGKFVSQFSGKRLMQQRLLQRLQRQQLLLVDRGEELGFGGEGV